MREKRKMRDEARTAKQASDVEAYAADRAAEGGQGDGSDRTPGAPGGQGGQGGKVMEAAGATVLLDGALAAEAEAAQRLPHEGTAEEYEYEHAVTASALRSLCLLCLLLCVLRLLRYCAHSAHSAHSARPAHSARSAHPAHSAHSARSTYVQGFTAADEAYNRDLAHEDQQEFASLQRFLQVLLVNVATVSVAS